MRGKQESSTFETILLLEQNTGLHTRRVQEFARAPTAIVQKLEEPV